MHLSVDDFRRRIEYSLCQGFASRADVEAFVENAVQTGVGVVCLNPPNLAQAVKKLAGTNLEISGNVGFPFGSHPPDVKKLETEYCAQAGATQIDMVMDIGALKSGLDEHVRRDINGVVLAAEGRLVKVIIEAWVLSKEEKLRASRLVEEAGAGMVKTSTGVQTQYLSLVNSEPRGATVDDVALIRSAVSPALRIKASGGIYTLDDALDLLRAGADQLGVSRGAELIREFQSRYPEGTLID